jgi:hypothetical protein
LPARSLHRPSPHPGRTDPLHHALELGRPAGRPLPGRHHRLRQTGRLSRLSPKRNLLRLIASLRDKLALEIIAEGNSRTRQGKTYRIYSPAEILGRRSQAGYHWFFRNRLAVRLVKLADHPAAASSFPATPPSAGSENEAAPAPPPATRDKIQALLGDDEQTTRKLIEYCEDLDAATTPAEILHFLEQAVAALRRSPPIPNWKEKLLILVPRFFYGPSLALQRFRAQPQSSSNLDR